MPKISKSGKIKIEMHRFDWLALDYMIREFLQSNEPAGHKIMIGKLYNIYKYLVEQPESISLTITSAMSLHYVTSLNYSDKTFEANQARIHGDLGRYKYLWIQS